MRKYFLRVPHVRNAKVKSESLDNCQVLKNNPDVPPTPANTTPGSEENNDNSGNDPTPEPESEEREGVTEGGTPEPEPIEAVTNATTDTMDTMDTTDSETTEAVAASESTDKRDTGTGDGEMLVMPMDIKDGNNTATAVTSSHLVLACLCLLGLANRL